MTMSVQTLTVNLKYPVACGLPAGNFYVDPMDLKTSV
jgi:hypothetical protein